MIKISKAAILILAFSCYTSAAELKYNYGSVKFGYADWNAGMVNTHRGDLWKFVADYGAEYDKGEYYSYFEYNKVDHERNNRNYTVSASGHYRLGASEISLYGETYAKFENTWGDELNNFLGFGYLGLSGEQGYFKPFIAIHDLSSDYVSEKHGSASGMNGYVFGWNAAYYFNWLEHNFTLSNWTQIEFARNKSYAEEQYKDYGINGGLTLAWRFSPDLSASVTWRYFDNKLGYRGWGDQMIYLVSYHF